MRAATIFNGVYTIQNVTTGEHRTFQIRTQPDHVKFAPGQRIIQLLVGPDNTSNYKGFGFVNDETIVVWKKFRGGQRKSDYEWYAEMIWDLATKGSVGRWSNYRLLIEGRCIRCNRRLTHPDSIDSGIGPECGKRQFS